MENRYIKLGQIWKLPICDNGTTSSSAIGYRINNSSGIVGFYIISEKNSNQMWKLTRLFTTPDVKIERDSLHNAFWYREFIVQNGELVSKKGANLKTLKLLYGSK